MNTANTINVSNAAVDNNSPAITRKYGNKTYEVYVHFSETSKETMTDKIMRLIKNEINSTNLS